MRKCLYHLKINKIYITNPMWAVTLSLAGHDKATQSIKWREIWYDFVPGHFAIGAIWRPGDVMTPWLLFMFSTNCWNLGKVSARTVSHHFIHIDYIITATESQIDSVCIHSFGTTVASLMQAFEISGMIPSSPCHYSFKMVLGHCSRHNAENHIRSSERSSIWHF